MRIGIDARYLSHGLAGGVHTYVSELIRSLIEIGNQHEFVLYADAKRPFDLTDLGRHVVVRVLPWRSAWSSVVNDLRFASQLTRDGVEVAHFPANYGVGPGGCATVVTVHDALNLLPLRRTLWSHGSPQSARTRAMSAYLRWWTTRSAQRADLVLTVSEFSRAEIIRVTGLSDQRVVAIPHGPPRTGGSVTDPATLQKVRGAVGVHEPFVLADALKNPEVLLRAWARLSPDIRQNRTIVFFARHRDLFPAVYAAIEDGTARLVVRPSSEALAALYSMADAFVFPSWIEGFGLPALEAMTYGAPLICSTRGALPEVVGNAARLVAPDDAAGLARALAAVLTDPAERARLRQLGFERAKHFSWRTTAQCVLECYARAAEGHRA